MKCKDISTLVYDLNFSHYTVLYGFLHVGTHLCNNYFVCRTAVSPDFRRPQMISPNVRRNDRLAI